MQPRLDLATLLDPDAMQALHVRRRDGRPRGARAVDDGVPRTGEQVAASLGRPRPAAVKVEAEWATVAHDSELVASGTDS
jgi:hypothetical protein